MNKFKNTAESTAALELIEAIVEVETEATEFKVFESTSEVRNKVSTAVSGDVCKSANS